ncbi:MAG: aspartate--tRNA(Asn) ligase [Firmicutes bacterium]|nr:aspartate--tRNA(Asn) ligase [Bacillota bacterium]
MNRITIKELENHIGETVEVQGFIANIRDLQYVQFIILRDGTGTIQMTIEKSEEKNRKFVELISNTTIESTMKATVYVAQNEKVKLRGMELIPEKIEITSVSLEELPIDLKNKEKTLRETRLDYRFLDLRREENHLLFQCETIFEHAAREFFLENQFMEIHSPKITAKSAESGAEVFHLDYFGENACLSQSPQFYKQMAMASGFEQVFEIGPAFRAENSHTSYHATEINMLDAEASWLTDVNEVMDIEENLLRHMFRRLKETYGEKIENTFHVTLSDCETPFPRISFEEAKHILKEEMNYVGERSDDFERHEEELLCEYAKKKYQSDFIFVTHFPFEARPFYHMLDEHGRTKSYDLLFKGVEITTGSIREHRLDILTKQIKEKGINPDKLAFYLEFFKYGCPPHGGFAIGIARMMMQIFEIDNIREATFVYRGPTRLNP